MSFLHFLYTKKMTLIIPKNIIALFEIHIVTLVEKKRLVKFMFNKLIV